MILGFFDFIKDIFQPTRLGNIIHIYLEDEKCGEKIKLLVRKSYDIQKIYEDNDQADYRLKKVVICNKCYNKISLKIDYDRRYKIIDSQLDGGNIISEKEFKEN